MKQNMGNMDKIIRAIIGIVALVLALFVTKGAADVILYIVAGIMLITALFGICPLYMVFNINTRK